MDVSDIIARIAAETNRAKAAEVSIDRAVVKHIANRLPSRAAKIKRERI